MGEPLHSYPRYIADWRNSKARRKLPIEARYIYWELIDQCYLDGSISEDIEELAVIAAVPEKVMRKHWPVIREFFQPADEGGFTHNKVDEVMSRIVKYREQRKEAGKRSAERRLKQQNGNETATSAERDGQRNTQRDSNERSTSVGTLVQPSITITTTTSTSTTPPPYPPPGEGHGAGPDLQPWHQAGFEAPEDFEPWWNALLERHPNRNQAPTAKTKLIAMIQLGLGHFNREHFELWHAAMLRTEGWKKQGGRYATNLHEIVEGRMWRFAPPDLQTADEDENPEIFAWRKDAR